ncbi:MAG: hypothetical protein D8M61_15110 [Ignavibacteriae bacterium]|nr:hypothetical protein [Ignavibacteriota bacterium]
MSYKIKYSSLSTFELIERISVHEDHNALNCFLSFRKLLTINNKRILLADYLLKLKEGNFYPYLIIPNKETKLEEKLDLIYDRTLQKFSVLKKYSEKIEGPYCNNQYNELYKQLNDYYGSRSSISQLDLELKAESLLKGMVIRHLKYSWLEVCRKTNRLYQRYRWVLAKGVIELMKPVSIKGREFTKWLEEHIENPDPSNKGEKYRIQNAVDNWFGHSSEIDYELIAYMQNDKIDPNFDIERYPENFTTLIANEKSTNINKLRPSIRSLGKTKLKMFISKILDNIVYDEDKDISIAKEFGLSKAAYSRFAGKNWKNNNKGEVPDLWKNIAHIITSDPILIELAISLGINTDIDSILKLTKTR